MLSTAATRAATAGSETTVRCGADLVTDAQLPLALLVQVAADRVQTMDVHTWRNRSTDAARWLAFLATTGYVLAEIEQHVVDEANAEPASEGSDDPEEDEAA